MGVKPRGCLHYLFMGLGGMSGVVIWAILGLTLMNSIEEQTGRAIDSYGLLFFVPYFTSMIVFAGVGSWLGGVFTTYRRSSVIASDLKDRPESGKRLLIRTSKSELFAALALAVMFFVSPFLVLLIGEVNAASQLLLFVAGPAISLVIIYVLTPQKLFSNEPQIIIDKSGITSRRWKNGFVPWQDIDQIWLEYNRSYRSSVPVINVLLKDTHKTLKLNLIGLDRNAEEVWNFIRGFRVAEKLALKGIRQHGVDW